MLSSLKRFNPLLLACLAVLGLAKVQAATREASDLTQQPTLYVVAYAHLDTQWRWEYPRTIAEFLPKTLHDNFALFEKYPHYVFNFTGANRYRMMKEYYPADYAKLKEYVKAGRWFPAGSSMEEGDVNSPSAESIIRQILYGTQYFRREFGKSSAEYMLPDCFGFPASLPSILAHMGIRGFSTQKLTWGSAAPVGGEDSPERTPVGTPFNVGIWEGPDGRSVIAALNPGSYAGPVRTDLSRSPAPLPSHEPTPGPTPRPPVDWPKRIDLNGKVSGLYVDYHYYGTGDTGGSPREDSVKLMEQIVTQGTAVLPGPEPQRGQPPAPPPSGPEVKVGDGPVKVIAATAEQMFLDIKPDQAGRLPRYKGDLLLTNHSAGAISSETFQKRWNRKNELLADAAERASVAAEWLGGRVYPRERLNNAWTLVMGAQFHDILPGTATPKAFEYAWNDDVLAMNQFASVLTSAAEAISSGLNTQTVGTPVVVYNPLDIAREDVVEGGISLPQGAPKGIRVLGPDGKEVPSQLIGASGTTAKILFLAKVPSVGFAVFDVQAVPASPLVSTLKIEESSLENPRYRVQVDPSGDVASIFDKTTKRELLSGPARLALQTEKPKDYPAWNMDWSDQQKPPRAYVQGPAKIRVIEKGPVRVALEIERETEGSRFVETIRLSAGGAGNRVEFGNIIDWKTREAALKATFPLTASNSEATYNWDVGTIERGNNSERKFEVPSHQWFDLTDKSGAWGVTVLSDCKNASDKPDDNTLRLTLLYTPGLGEGNGRAYSDQTSQDWGHHEFSYGLAGHAGTWRTEQTDWQAYRLNQPLVAFEAPKHLGSLGKRLSLLSVNNSRVRVFALKKAEDGDEVIVRLVEVDGKPQESVRIAFPSPIIAGREVNGQEQAVGAATVSRGELEASFGPYELRTFAVRLALPATKLAKPRFVPVKLPYDRLVATSDGTKTTAGFDASGHSLPAEMLPNEISYAGIRFDLAPARDGKPNAVVAKGQKISLPPGRFNRLYVLAASEGDQKATFRVGERPIEVTVQDWSGYVGQWDNRLWTKREEPVPPPRVPPGTTAPAPAGPPRMRTVLEYVGLTPGFIKRSHVAWFASHRHTSDGANEPYAYSYLFSYPLELPPNATHLTLPDNDKIRILALTASDETGQVRPVQPLYDTLERASN